MFYAAADIALNRWMFSNQLINLGYDSKGGECTWMDLLVLCNLNIICSVQLYGYIIVRKLTIYSPDFADGMQQSTSGVLHSFVTKSE